MDLIQEYLEYTHESEPHAIYHRWCIISAIGALIGRKRWIQFGYTKIFPTVYSMLLGEPAARKSTAIKMMKPLVRGAGFMNIAADRTSKEKFLVDLEGLEIDDAPGMQGGFGHNSKKAGINGHYDTVTANNLWGADSSTSDPREVFVMADEFNEFSGVNNQEFYTTLGNLWDWHDEVTPYEQRLKGSRSISIWQPTVSILGGNTPELFARAFPPEIIGTGFLSRLLIIHGVQSGRKYTIPPTPNPKHTAELVSILGSILRDSTFELGISSAAFGIFDDIYKKWPALDDLRFKSYSSRRATQLYKLAIIVSTSRGHTEISGEDVVLSNTILSAAERNMPIALGEFGKSKNSDIANKVMDALNKASAPMNIQELWVYVNNDLERTSQLADIIESLSQAGKIQVVKLQGGKTGLLPLKKVKRDPDHVNWNLLTQEERDML